MFFFSFFFLRWCFFPILYVVFSSFIRIASMLCSPRRVFSFCFSLSLFTSWLASQLECIMYLFLLRYMCIMYKIVGDTRERSGSVCGDVTVPLLIGIIHLVCQAYVFECCCCCWFFPRSPNTNSISVAHAYQYTQPKSVENYIAVCM